MTDSTDIRLIRSMEHVDCRQQEILKAEREVDGQEINLHRKFQFGRQVVHADNILISRGQEPMTPGHIKIKH